MNRKVTLISILLISSLGAIFSFEYVKFHDGRLHLVFCDVGQGDGIFIRTPSGKNIVIDAGPDEKIINCIEGNIPFWDRKIDLAMLTHPHLDHFYGFNYIFKKYRVSYFATEKLENRSESFKNFKDSAKKANIKTNYVYAGDKFKIKDKVTLTVLGPSKDFIQRTSSQGQIGESGEFASLIILVSYGNFQVLTTGDSQSGGLTQALSADAKNIDVLEVPHHGSKTGISEEILSISNPGLSVISVGKNNKYGHPASYTLDLLKKFNIPILRTDKDGEIEIVSDGKTWARVD